MNKHIIQAFIILIIILLGVSLISESNDKANLNGTIQNLEDKIENNEEINNGNMVNVNVVEEDSSNLLSDVNAKLATIVVEGLNLVFKFGIKLIESAAN